MNRNFRASIDAHWWHTSDRLRIAQTLRNIASIIDDISIADLVQWKDGQQDFWLYTSQQVSILAFHSWLTQTHNGQEELRDLARDFRHQADQVENGSPTWRIPHPLVPSLRWENTQDNGTYAMTGYAWDSEVASIELGSSITWKVYLAGHCKEGMSHGLVFAQIQAQQAFEQLYEAINAETEDTTASNERDGG